MSDTKTMSDTKLYVGIDLARRAPHKAVALAADAAASPRAARSKAVSFSHDRKGFEALRDRLIEQAGREVPECDRLEGMPGVGKVVSVTPAAVLSPVTRFANAKKCSAYTGFTSRKKSSGARDIEGLKITKAGNRRFKRDLGLAAEPAMSQDPQMAAFAIRLLRAGKHYDKVRVAVGRKVAVCAYSLLKRYHAGQTDVAYVWRDLQGRPVSKRQAQEQAALLWTAYEAEQKKKGSSPTPAHPWQSENSTTQALDELPEVNHA